MALQAAPLNSLMQPSHSVPETLDRQAKLSVSDSGVGNF